MEMIRKFWMEEDGVGVVEIILILVVLIALVVVFRKEITQIVTDAFEKIGEDTDTIIGGDD